MRKKIKEVIASVCVPLRGFNEPLFDRYVGYPLKEESGYCWEIVFGTNHDGAVGINQVSLKSLDHPKHSIFRQGFIENVYKSEHLANAHVEEVFDRLQSFVDAMFSTFPRLYEQLGSTLSIAKRTDI